MARAAKDITLATWEGAVLVGVERVDKDIQEDRGTSQGVVEVGMVDLMINGVTIQEIIIW